ncbi:hypothetical protein C6Y02_17065 [Bacillus sp. NMCC4]|nr:hypothetical protein C6Y02_17065 [Bacillus sp. NMCC4]
MQSVKITASLKEVRDKKVRVPVGTDVQKKKRVDVYCKDNNTLHQFIVKNFVIQKTCILINLA